MKKDTGTNEERQPVLKTWQEFEERVLVFNRKDWRTDPQKFKDEMRAIRHAYHQGADREGQKMIRIRQMNMLRLTDNPISFFRPEKHLTDDLARAKAIGVGLIISAQPKPEKQKPQKVAKKLPQKVAEKLPAIGKGWVTTDRVFNLLYNDPERGLKIFGDFNYRVKWFHDCITHVLKRNLVDKVKPKMKEALFKPEDGELIARDIIELRSYWPSLKLTDNDFRRITGLQHISGKEICELADKYSELYIKGKLFAYWDEANNRWAKAKLSGHLAEVVPIETGKISPRGEKPKHEYHILLGAGGFLLFHNLLHHRLKAMPKKFYRQLKGGSQDIYRYIAQFNVSDLSIQTVSKILGYGETKYIHKRIKQVDTYLNELKEKGFIRNWSRNKRGWKTTYHIRREGKR